MTSSDFNKKLTVEKELIKSDMFKFANLEFDRTGFFLLCPSMIGENEETFFLFSSPTSFLSFVKPNQPPDDPT